MPGHVERHSPGEPMRPDAVEMLAVNLDGAEQVLINRQRSAGDGRHREQVPARKQGLHTTEQRGAREHRLLVIDAADFRGERDLLDEGLAEDIAMLRNPPCKARAPNRMVDGAPDRLDVKSLAGKFLELSTKVRKAIEARVEGGRDIGGHGTSGRRGAEPDLLPAQIAARAGGADE